MNRDQIIAALDAAFADHISKLFGALITEMATRNQRAIDQFAEGLSLAKTAYASARAEIERAP